MAITQAADLVGMQSKAEPVGQNLHRNVIFRGNAAPNPFTSVDSSRPEDLWSWLDNIRREGYEALAIPHNGNASNGLMYDWVDSRGKPIDQGYAEDRAWTSPIRYTPRKQ